MDGEWTAAGTSLAVPGGAAGGFRGEVWLVMNTAMRVHMAVALSALLASCSYFQRDYHPKAPPRPAPPQSETRVVPIIQSPPEPNEAEKQTAAIPQSRPVPKPNVVDPKILVGLDQVAVEELVGKPLGIYDEPPATVWSYKSEDCTLDVFFYLDIATHKLRALSYDVKTGTKSDRDGAARLCIGRIQAENHAKQR